MARSAVNGAGAMPSNEMLAAPSRKATQTRAGGPGRASAAITSHNTSNAGAIAAAPITVGRDSSSSIERNFTYRVENGRKFSALQEHQGLIVACLPRQIKSPGIVRVFGSQFFVPKRRHRIHA